MYKNLPHIESEYQFITFRTYDSVDEFVKKIHLSTVTISRKQQAIDEYLDVSKNGAYLNGEVLDYMNEFLKSKDGNFYELIAYAVMANHIHLLIKPLLPTNKIIKDIKGISANRINKMLSKKGKFWESDYFDKAIRDEKHFSIVYNYIKNNPLKLTNADNSKRFYGKYE